MANKKKDKKIALITGITGQDGSYLTEILLKKGYELHGIIRRASTFNTSRLEPVYQDPHGKDRHLFLHYGDMADAETIRRLIYKIKPDEIYNLGAQSHVRVSFDIPEYTMNITGLGCVRILEAIKDFQDDTGKKVKFYQASSSEMFGAAKPPQNEKTRFQPQSPYGCAKVLAYHATCLYRQAYGIFAVNGILFNHESPRRGETFVTRKISRGVARIKAGLDQKLYLGNLDAKRDWGYAPEYCAVMWKMLQQKEPSDFVIATGETHSIREFAEEAFRNVGIDIVWRGRGINEKGVDRKTSKELIRVDARYFRPSEVNYLCGDVSKAKKALDWKPGVSFKELVKVMMEADTKSLNGNLSEFGKS